MNPLLIALAVAGVAAWMNGSGKKNPAIKPTVPGNSGTGITTGFGAPGVQANSGLVPSGTQTNVPNAAPSGVPGYASIADAFAALANSPGPGFGVPPMFYTGTTPTPPVSSVQPQATTSQNGGGQSCNCGGNCNGSGSCAGQNKQGSSLAPTQSTQVNQPASQPVIAQTATSATSGPIPSSDFDIYQNMVHAAHAHAFAPGGAGEHVEPASPWLSPIGLSPSRIYGQ